MAKGGKAVQTVQAGAEKRMQEGVEEMAPRRCYGLNKFKEQAFLRNKITILSFIGRVRDLHSVSSQTKSI